MIFVVVAAAILVALTGCWGRRRHVRRQQERVAHIVRHRDRKARDEGKYYRG